MRQLTLPDGTLFYQERGTGVPILLLHAGVADSRMWDPQFDFLALSRRVIRCDLRGFGQSQLPNGPFAYHEDISRLLDGLDIDTTWLIGASFGA